VDLVALLRMRAAEMEALAARAVDPKAVAALRALAEEFAAKAREIERRREPARRLARGS
jgi:hypothetical protein